MCVRGRALCVDDVRDYRSALRGVDCNILLAGGADSRHILASIDHVVRTTDDLERLMSGREGVLHVSGKILRTCYDTVCGLEE